MLVHGILIIKYTHIHFTITVWTVYLSVCPDVSFRFNSKSSFIHWWDNLSQECDSVSFLSKSYICVSYWLITRTTIWLISLWMEVAIKPVHFSGHVLMNYHFLQFGSIGPCIKSDFIPTRWLKCCMYIVSRSHMQIFVCDGWSYIMYI